MSSGHDQETGSSPSPAGVAPLLSPFSTSLLLVTIPSYIYSFFFLFVYQEIANGAGRPIHIVDFRLQIPSQSSLEKMVPGKSRQNVSEENRQHSANLEVFC